MPATESLREKVAQLIMAADEDTLNYERRYPEWEGERWHGYLIHADALLPLIEAERQAAASETARAIEDEIGQELGHAEEHPEGSCDACDSAFAAASIAASHIEQAPAGSVPCIECGGPT